MDGIEKITAKIAADTQAEIDALTAQARSEADEIAAGFRNQADALKAELRAKGERDAAQREERMTSVAQLECRKVELGAKQALLDRAFDRALEKLCALEDKECVELLAKLLVKASASGREQVVFNQKDRARVGKAAVTRANELLAQAVAPELPKVATGSAAVNAIAEKVSKAVTAVSAMTQGTAMLTLAEETRPIQGGFILLDGRVETNCAFETLVRLEKTAMAGEVAKLLFD